MKILKQCVACVCLVLTSNGTMVVDGWRGILPLRSTCNDVRRKLGVSKCNFPESTYHLGGETVRVTFSTARRPCTARHRDKRWDVPYGTVIEVEVFLKKPLPLSDFNVHDSKYEQVFNDFVDEVIYNSAEKGISLTTVGGEVRSIIYFPATKDTGLRCN